MYATLPPWKEDPIAGGVAGVVVLWKKLVTLPVTSKLFTVFAVTGKVLLEVETPGVTELLNPPPAKL